VLSNIGLLHKLAQLYGIQVAYYGSDHKRNPARVESIIAILKSLGAPVTSSDDLQSAYQARQKWKRKQFIEPVIVAWDGNLESITVHSPDDDLGSRYNILLILEDGTQHSYELSQRNIVIHQPIEIDTAKYYEKTLVLKKKLPFGYHCLKVETRHQQADALILSAPVKSFNISQDKPEWGVFIPLYSLHSSRSWGAGNFSDIGTLADWVANEGGKSIASLPLLPAYLDKPYEPSPYLPLTRLFWNEFYIDITRIPELSGCPEAQEQIASQSFQKSIRSLQQSQRVDYSHQMVLQRMVLAKLSEYFFSADSTRYQHFKQYIANHPELEQYACFRAVMEKQGKPWRQWQGHLRGGILKAEDYDEHIKQYHLYVQWLAQEQLQDVAQNAIRKGLRLYLDLPLGTHPDGFDTWRYQDIFIDDVSVGAPPDSVFTQGQNWTFPPLHPDKIRETGYAYVIAYLRNHLQYARILRIDHMMALHRLFFIPHGHKSGYGMYVRYHPEEFYAIISIESHRHQSVIVGEDLGIVPRSVRTAMDHHSIQHMWVMHYELAGNKKVLLPAPRLNSVASLNTHDMPPFASFWTGQDIADRERVGIINQSKGRKESITRSIIKNKLIAFLVKRRFLHGRVTMLSVLKGCLSYLAASRSRLILINLEDLWLETHTQNIPGTTSEHPNWHWKARLSLEDFCQTPQTVTILREINKLRLLEGIKHGARKTEKRNRV
jgi:4-alpha-glucanotransferase